MVTLKVWPNYTSSILFVGFFIFQAWEATLVTSLFVRKVVLPFDGIEELVLFSDSKIVVVPDSAMMDTFKFSKDPIWQRAWSERIAPNMDFYEAYLNSEKSTIIWKCTKLILLCDCRTWHEWLENVSAGNWFPWICILRPTFRWQVSKQTNVLRIQFK